MIDQDFEDLPEIEQEQTKKPRKNRKGTNAIDYVDNQELFEYIFKWQQEANDWAVQNEDTLLHYYPEKKDGNSFEKAVAAARQANAISNEPRIPDIIGLSILQICENFSQKPNWSGYTWRDEMVDDAVTDCVRGVRKFNSINYSNAFGYFTKIANWAFTGRIQKEKQENERKLTMAFDPTNAPSYSVIQGDTTVYDIKIDEVSDFFHNGKAGS